MNSNIGQSGAASASPTQGDSPTTTTQMLRDGSVFRIYPSVAYLAVGPAQSTSFRSIPQCIEECNTSECIGVYGNYSLCYFLRNFDSYQIASYSGAFGAYIISPGTGRPTATPPASLPGTLSTLPIPADLVTTLVDPPAPTPSGSSASPVPNSAQTSGPGSTPGSNSTSPSQSFTPGGVDGDDGGDGGGGGSGISAGAVAGAAVGAAIGGALLAFLLAFLLLRRRRPRSASSSAALLSSEKSSPSSHRWDAYLPQAYDDQKIATGVHTLLTQISQHVENYYGNNFAAADFDRARAFLNTVDSGRLQVPLEQLMPEVRDAVPVIKHCFAWWILGKLSPSASPEETLLPPEYGRLPPTLAAASGQRGEGRAASQAYNYWRVLTAYLMYPNPNSTSSPSHGDQLSPASARAIDVLTAAFAPWAKSSQAGQEHLKSVLRSATDTGLLVLSQSSSFSFEWDVLRKDDGKDIVVSPAFVKTADEHGDTLEHRQVLVKPQVESI